MSVLLFTGNSGSGKTTLAEHLTNNVVRERTICHDLANRHGYERTRYWLKAVGAQRVAAKLAWETAVVVAEEYDGSLLIVDGAYDPALPRMILDRAPQVEKIGIIAVNAAPSLRAPRIAQRLGGVSLETAAAEMDFLDNTKARFGVDEMMAAADLSLDGAQSLEASSASVRQLLDRLPNLRSA